MGNENKEYEIGQAKHSQQRPRGPMGRGMGGGEKAKDLVGTWKKLLGYCKKYSVILVIAIICAAVGTICTLAGPDKLSEMTDTVTGGIAPDTDKLQEIVQAVSENISSNMENVMTEIGTNLNNPTKAPEALEINGSEISVEDQMTTMQIFAALQQDDKATPKAADSQSSVDAQNTVDSQNSTDNKDAADDTQSFSRMAEIFSQLPVSVVQALYSDITVDGAVISGKDQQTMLDLMSNLNTDDTDAMLKVFDELPESIYNLVKPSIDLEKVTHIGLFLVCLYLLSYVLSAIQGWIMSTITQRVSKQLRSDISCKINRLPMWYYSRTTTGDVLSRVTNDVDTIGQSFNQSIGNLISALILFIGSLVMMIKTNIIMTLTAVGASLIGFIIMFAIMGRSQKYFRRQQNHLGEINGHIEEIYAGHTVVKAYNGEEAAEKTFDEMNAKLRESGFKAQCLSGLMMPIMTFIGNLGYVAVCVVGGALALNGNISFGVIVAFMMYVRYFTQPLSQIAQAVQTLQSAAAAGERVFEFLEAEEMDDETGKVDHLDHVRCEVTFDHVKFGYEDSDRIIIHDFSAEAKPGQKIAIVGPTGAGKSTMVNLLMRFHEIQSGKICIDGVPTNEMTREAVHSQFCMVLQDTWLFEGTVRENLVYCTQNVSDEKVKKACKAVGLDYFIKTLPHGYDTVLNDQVNLSQGQKQQLTIARAMIADKPMLILDEATSSVDTRTEQQIQTAMDALMENRTSFVIAHRLSTIKNADLILVLKDGDIIESGNHDELMAKGGFYAELYNSQFDQAS